VCIKKETIEVVCSGLRRQNLFRPCAPAGAGVRRPTSMGLSNKGNRILFVTADCAQRGFV